MPPITRPPVSSPLPAPPPVSSIPTQPKVPIPLPIPQGGQPPLHRSHGPEGEYRGESVRSATDKSPVATKGDSKPTNVNVHTLSKRSVLIGETKQASSMDAAARTAGLQHSLPDMKLERLDKLVFFLENEIQAKAGGEPAANVAPIVAAEGEVELVVGEDQQHKNLKSDEKQSVSESSHKGAGSHQLKNDIFSELQRLFPDITHQFAALELVREYFERKKAKDEKRLRELLDEAKAEFESSPEMMRDIRAGFAVEPAMQDFVVSLGGDPASTGEMSQAFRDTYRRMLRQESHFGRLFDAIKKFDVAKNFTEIVDVFMNTIGRDLASTGPSTDRAFLHALMTELGKLKNLRSVFEAVKELITTTERSLPTSDRGKLDPMGLASDILNFCAKSVVSLTDAQALVQSLKGYSLQIQVVFANGVIDLLATIPDNVIDSRARLQQKATLNTLRDHLVAAEEKDHEAHAT